MSQFKIAEAAARGHPDKLADQISDKILDECRIQDPFSRVGVEVLISKNVVVIGGEISTNAEVDYIDCAQKVIRSAGYNSQWGYDPNTLDYVIAISQQSPEIAQSIISPSIMPPRSPNSKTRAGDQGVMYGMAINETEDLMPLPITLAHSIMKSRDTLSHSSNLIGPDGKCEISIRYENINNISRPIEISYVLISSQHAVSASHEEVKQALYDSIAQVLPHSLITENTQICINPSKKFTVGGPLADTGLTGRKIISDTYGPSYPHGGGAFSGKDPTKMDRTGAYAARYAAKHVVSAKLASFCEIWLAYAIGNPDPVAVSVDTRSTGTVPDFIIAEALREIFDFSVDGIISMLQLNSCSFFSTAWRGHFGGSSLPWERLDRIEELRAQVQRKL